MKTKKVILTAAIFVFAGITFLSLLPPQSDIHIHTNDKIGHFIAYGVFALNVSLIENTKNKRFLLLLGVLAYSMLIEFLQHFVGRETSLNDFFANLSGVTLGYLFYLLLGEKIILFLNKIFN